MLRKKESEVTQSCPTLRDPMDCSLPGSSVHGLLQAGILEWVAISFSRESSQPRDRTQVFRTAGRRFTIREMLNHPAFPGSPTSQVMMYYLFCVLVQLGNIWSRVINLCLSDEEFFIYCGVGQSSGLIPDLA